MTAYVMCMRREARTPEELFAIETEPEMSNAMADKLSADEKLGRRAA